MICLTEKRRKIKAWNSQFKNWSWHLYTVGWFTFLQKVVNEKRSSLVMTTTHTRIEFCNNWPHQINIFSVLLKLNSKSCSQIYSNLTRNRNRQVYILAKKWLLLGRGGGQVVSLLTIYTDDPCLNPAEDIVFSLKFVFENHGEGHFY